jgi:hypothetical protein
MISLNPFLQFVRAGAIRGIIQVGAALDGFRADDSKVCHLIQECAVRFGKDDLDRAGIRAFDLFHFREIFSHF